MRQHQLLILWEVFPTARLSPQLNSYRRSSSLFPSSLRPVEILNVRNCVGVKYLTNCSSIWSSHHHDYPQNSTATDDHHHCYVIIATNINFDCSKLRWCEILLINLMITSSWFHHDYPHNSITTEDHHHCYVIIATNINFECSKGLGSECKARDP